MHRYLSALLLLSAAFAQSNYHQLRKITVGGEGGWDYLIADASSARVYVSHGAEVAVVDSKTGQVAGRITGLHGVHGIALAPEFNRGFISNGQSGGVTIFDLKTLEKIGDDVPAGKNPDAIIYDPGSKRVFAFNGRSSDATAIDAKDGKVAGTVALEGKPEFAAADGKGHVYVNIEDKSQVFDIDSKKLTVEHRWSLAPCEEPSGMAMDTKSRRLFAGCHNKMVAVMNADTGKVVATPEIGSGVDATAFDPETKFVFNSCGDGTLSIIKENSPTSFAITQTVTTMPSAKTMALDTKTNRILLIGAEFEAPPALPPGGRAGRGPMLADSFSIIVVSK